MDRLDYWKHCQRCFLCCGSLDCLCNALFYWREDDLRIPFLKQRRKIFKPLNLHVLISLSIATSIDALEVGFTFSFLDIAIIAPVLIIGTVTFFFSLAGTYVGSTWGHVFEDKVELIG